MFDHPSDGKDGGERLLQLTQEDQPAADYSLAFHTLAAASGWNDRALRTAYRRGLRDDMKTELACRDDVMDLNMLISTSIKRDDMLRERRKAGSQAPSRCSPPLPTGTPHHLGTEDLPMEIGGSPDPSKGRRWPRRERSTPRQDHVSPNPVPKSQLCLIPIQIHHGSSPLMSTALIDSGAAGNLIDYGLVTALGLPTQRLKNPRPVTSLDGRPLGTGTITHCTSPITITISTSPPHQEKIVFHILTSLLHKVVLGIPWLCKHQPIINWSQNRIISWGSSCRETCQPLVCASTTVESPTGALQVCIPREYQEFQDVFSPSCSTQLPPH